MHTTTLANPDITVYSNKKNGYGIEIIFGRNDFSKDMLENETFVEFDPIISIVQQFKAVRVQGQPGAGKSEILSAMHLSAYQAGVSSLLLKSHINGGRYDGLQNISPPLNEYVKHTRYLGGLILLDNLDFVGYKGQRTRSSAMRYSEEYMKFVELIMHNDSNLVVATAHTDEWRKGNWRWEPDSPITVNANTLLDMIKPVFDYSGLVKKSHALRFLADRIIDEQIVDPMEGYTKAKFALDYLENQNLDNYKYTKLLNSKLIIKGRVQEAIDEIKAGTKKRNHN